MRLRHRGFREQARDAGVTDERVLDAMASVPRRLFVPAGEARHAGLDEALRLPFGQTTSQPSLVAAMVEALHPTPSSVVLEVGTGFGYEAAVLSRLVAQVWTIECVPELAAAAAHNLDAFGATNVHVVVGDGNAGLPEHAPYDGIVVAAQTERVPDALLAQLAVDGRIVVPLGGRVEQECVVLARDPSGRLQRAGDLGWVSFVPLVRGED